MARMGPMSFSFPDFRGATRRLILVNLGAFFVLLLGQLADARFYQSLLIHCSFVPQYFLHGWIWQPFTYSLVQVGIGRTLFALLSLWFLAGFLEGFRGDSWVMVAIRRFCARNGAIGGGDLRYRKRAALSAGAGSPYRLFRGHLRLLAAIGILYGDTEFMLFPLPINIKARYIAIIYALITVAWLFGDQRMYAFAQLGGALAGIIYIRTAPRRGVSFAMSETWYGLRNQYYRWKRRRAGRKFEVYMRKQGRTVKFDNQGRPIDDDPNDRSRWN